MHTVELLEEAIALAVERGFGVRQDWFGGAAGGACEIKGERWVFIDLALHPREQLHQVLDALEDFSDLPHPALNPQLQALLKTRKAT